MGPINFVTLLREKKFHEMYSLTWFLTRAALEHVQQLDAQ